jgi:FkbM family methyltransferase
MIPTIDTLGSVADDVMKPIPQGLARGELAAGLYGLGFLGRWALPRIRDRGVKVVSCYDASGALNGTNVDGLPICATNDIKSAPPEFMFISARHAVQPVSAMLSGLGIPHVSYDAWHVASDFRAFRRIHDVVLCDERSREVLRAVLMAMLTGNKSTCADVFESGQYFCLPRFCGFETETYVDAGAFVGDSMERFIWANSGVFSKIHAFEPGRRQYAALQTRAARLVNEWALDPNSIELINAGLGDASGSAATASDSGALTSLTIRPGARAGDVADIVTLDRFLEGAPVTFLKADVEGMEMSLLKGAESTIRRWKPKLAICVYHYPSDIPDVTGYLTNLVPDYQFALRHHSPQLMETVLYCWAD